MSKASREGKGRARGRGAWRASGRKIEGEQEGEGTESLLWKGRAR